MTDSAEQVAREIARAGDYWKDYESIRCGLTVQSGKRCLQRVRAGSIDIELLTQRIATALRSSGWRTDVVERGSIVVALKDWRAIGNRPGLTAGRTYVVNEITHSSGWTYYKVITDDNEALSLSSGMFALQIPAPPVLPQPPASTEG